MLQTFRRFVYVANPEAAVVAVVGVVSELPGLVTGAKE